MKSISLGTSQSRMQEQSHSLRTGRSSPLLLTWTVRSTPLSLAEFLHVQCTRPFRASTSSTFRYTEEFSEPVKRY